MFCLPAVTSGQTTILKVGSNGYVNVAGQNYKRGYLGSNYTISGGDTFLSIRYAYAAPITMIRPAVDTQFLDGDNANAKFRSMAALRAWMDANFEATGQNSSVSITINGGGSGTGTATVPSGTVIKGISVKNLTRPTAPFTDEVISVPVWNVSGTTLTIYLQTAVMAIPSSDYLITCLY